MNYIEIVQSALSYADRKDDPELIVEDHTTQTAGDYLLINRMLRIVETRINRRLQTRKMSQRAYINTSKTVEYYGLPPDFAGLRDIEIRSNQAGSNRQTLAFVTPEYMNHLVATDAPGFYYSIINNQIQIYPKLDNYVLEVIYYQKVIPLSLSNMTNWVSDGYPDAYIQGLLVEISAFAKDTETAALWEQRFNSTLDEMVYEDAVDRWSGPTPVTRLM